MKFIIEVLSFAQFFHPRSSPTSEVLGYLMRSRNTAIQKWYKNRIHQVLAKPDKTNQSSNTIPLD